MFPTPYVASLRVYEPAESFDNQLQTHWNENSELYLSIKSEQLGSLKRVINGLAPKITLDGVHTLIFKGEKFFAPWSTTKRCVDGLSLLKLSLPTSIFHYLVPSQIEEDIGKTSQLTEDKISYILTSNWGIPPRWFALFVPQERLRGSNENGFFTVVRTEIKNAIARCKFTHQVVLEAFGKGTVEMEISELLDWLKVFDENSIIELDYGGLANYLNSSLILEGNAGLEADSSIEDVVNSIAGLASGDSDQVGNGYIKLVKRWRMVSAIETAS